MGKMPEHFAPTVAFSVFKEVIDQTLVAEIHNVVFVEKVAVKGGFGNAAFPGDNVDGQLLKGIGLQQPVKRI